MISKLSVFRTHGVSELKSRQRAMRIVGATFPALLLLVTVTDSGLAQGVDNSAGFGLARSAAAVPVAIVNPGFEDDFTPVGCFSVLTPNGWTPYDPNGLLDGNLDALGVIDPAGTSFFPAGAPEGVNVALEFLSGDLDGGPVGLSQILGDTLQANTTYTLTVQVGNIASGTGPPPCDVFGFFDLDNFPGYQVQLLAGGTVLAEDDNSLAGSIPEGEFRLSTLQAVIGGDPPQLGAPLEIRLINLNQIATPEHPGNEVDFDDVQLSTETNASAVPAMSTWSLAALVAILTIAGMLVLLKRVPIPCGLG